MSEASVNNSGKTANRGRSRPSLADLPNSLFDYQFLRTMKKGLKLFLKRSLLRKGHFRGRSRLGCGTLAAAGYWMQLTLLRNTCSTR